MNNDLLNEYNELIHEPDMVFETPEIVLPDNTVVSMYASILEGMEMVSARRRLFFRRVDSAGRGVDTSVVIAISIDVDEKELNEHIKNEGCSVAMRGYYEKYLGASLLAAQMNKTQEMAEQGWTVCPPTPEKPTEIIGVRLCGPFN